MISLFVRCSCSPDFSVFTFTTPFIPDTLYLSEVAEKNHDFVGWSVSRRFEPGASRLQKGLLKLYTAL
jgi:hypothetical protein